MRFYQTAPLGTTIPLTSISGILTTADRPPTIRAMVESNSNSVFAAAIAEIDREIEELQRIRVGLLRRLGAAGSDADPPGEARSQVFSGDPVAAVREQEFSGMTPAKATRAFLLKIGRHEKTPVILTALKKGGVQVGGKHPISTHYTTLKRHSGFVSLGKNYWDLAERRPDLVRAKSEKVNDKKASKAAKVARPKRTAVKSTGAKKEDRAAATLHE